MHCIPRPQRVFLEVASKKKKKKKKNIQLLQQEVSVSVYWMKSYMLSVSVLRVEH